MGKFLVAAGCALGILFALQPLDSYAKAKPKKKRAKVIRLEEMVIRGKIQKPEAMIILQRSTKARILEENAKNKKFVDRIILAVTDNNLK